MSSTTSYDDAPGARLAAGADTRERLLDAAERLFAERGFAGTSLRAVTRAADTSLSAANYHFGSKEELLRETLRRRIEPLNQRRLALLDASEAQAKPGAPELVAVLDAFLRPIFEERAERRLARKHARFVAARLYSEAPELVAQLLPELFGPLSERFVAALARALPERPPAELGLDFQLVVGAMVHIMSGHIEEAPSVKQLGAEGRALLADESLLRRMVGFCAAGLRAPEGVPA